LVAAGTSIKENFTWSQNLIDDPFGLVKRFMRDKVLSAIIFVLDDIYGIPTRIARSAVLPRGEPFEGPVVLGARVWE
jgi:hypothetical protein